jgi:hypothetical protein
MAVNDHGWPVPAGQWDAWSKAAQSDALSRPSEPMAACVWPVAGWTEAAQACAASRLAPPSGPPAGGVPSRVREEGAYANRCHLLPPEIFRRMVQKW